VTIADATKAFLARCRNRSIQPATFNKYRTFVKQLRSHSDSRGYLLIGQLTIADMDRFQASWKDGIRAKARDRGAKVKAAPEAQPVPKKD
jgi:hypothetical protein